MGREIIKPFIGGRNNAKPATQAKNEAPGEIQKQNEIVASEKLAYKVPQEIKGVPLTSAESKMLVDGKTFYIADMKGDNGEKFSSYVKMDKNEGKLHFYDENPDKARNTAVQYSKSQPVILEPKQANSKKIKI